MLIEQVDVVEAEARQRRVDDLADVLGAAIDAFKLAGPADAEAELGRHHDPIASPLQGLPKQPLVGEGAVDFGGIEIGDTEVERAVDRPDRLGIIRRPVGLAHAHAAEADGRHLQALSAEFAGRQHGRFPNQRCKIAYKRWSRDNGCERVRRRPRVRACLSWPAVTSTPTAARTRPRIARRPVRFSAAIVREGGARVGQQHVGGELDTKIHHHQQLVPPTCLAAQVHPGIRPTMEAPSRLS